MIAARPAPVHIVGGVPDWLAVAGTIATATAALLALGAIIQSGRQARRAERNLLRERRVDFTLSLLKDLADGAATWQQAQYRDSTLAIRARMLSEDLIPITRAALSLPSTAAAVAAVKAEQEKGGYAGTLFDLMKPMVQDELIRAVERVMSER